MTLIYGPIIMFVVVGACAATLAELASVYPTAGGQYHWTSILAPEKWSREIVSIDFHCSLLSGNIVTSQVRQLGIC